MKRLAIAVAATVTAIAIPSAAAAAATPGPAAHPRGESVKVRTVTVGSNPADIVISDKLSKAYVANDGSVSVLSMVTHRQLAEVKTGYQDQTTIGVVGRSTKAYIGTYDLKVIKVLNLKTLKITGKVQVGPGATAIVSARTGGTQYAYVTLLAAKRAAVISTSNDKLVKEIKLPQGPQTAETVPGGKFVWVGSSYSGVVWVVNTATQKVTRAISVAHSGPVSSIAFTSDGTRAWVYGLGGVTVVDVATGKLLAFVPMSRLFPNAAAPNAGPVALNNSGTLALLVNSTFPDNPGIGTVSVLNTRTLKVQASIKVGTEPTAMAIDRKRNTTYITNYEDDTVSYFATPK
jgi:YVTN family beta-propeller protein